MWHTRQAIIAAGYAAYVESATGQSVLCFGDDSLVDIVATYTDGCTVDFNGVQSFIPFEYLIVKESEHESIRKTRQAGSTEQSSIRQVIPGKQTRKALAAHSSQNPVSLAMAMNRDRIEDDRVYWRALAKRLICRAGVTSRLIDVARDEIKDHYRNSSRYSQVFNTGKDN